MVPIPKGTEGQTMGKGSDCEENARGNEDEGERGNVAWAPKRGQYQYLLEA